MNPTTGSGKSSKHHEEVAMEVYLKEKTSGITLTRTPLISEADESALRDLFPEAWNNPSHECPVTKESLETRLPRAIESIAKSLGQSSSSAEVTERMKPYKDFVQSVSQFESEGKNPVAVVHGIK